MGTDANSPHTLTAINYLFTTCIPAPNQPDSPFSVQLHALDIRCIRFAENANLSNSAEHLARLGTFATSADQFSAEPRQVSRSPWATWSLSLNSVSGACATITVCLPG